jgi:hypothetical protein
MIKKSISIWLLIIPLAMLNGLLRDKVITPIIGEKYAMPLSGIILCVLILFIALFFIPRLGKASKQTYLKIGLLWILLTVSFEFVFGFLRKVPFTEMINAYNITTGNLWLVIVLFVGIVPLFVAKMKRIV